MTVRDSGGNVQVDFVWGNFPLQPNDDRGLNTLDENLDNHIIATTGYANFPQFLPNYAGDGDTGFETVVPDFFGLAWDDAQAAAAAAGLTINADYWTPIVTSAVTSGKTATLTLDNSANLRAGMVISGLLSDGTDTMTFLDGKIKSVSEDGLTVVVTAKTAFAANVEWTTTNSSLFANWGGNTNPSYVLWQQNAAGQIVNSGSAILVAFLVNND